MMKRCVAIALIALLLISTFLQAAAEETLTYIAVNNDSPSGAQYLLNDCDESDGWFTLRVTVFCWTRLPAYRKK